MSLLRDRIERLESDLKAVPPRISVHHDLPFAILRYDPTEEWDLRRELRLLATRLESTGKTVHVLRMSEFLWQAIEGTEGLQVLVGLEQSSGYPAAQKQVTTYLSDPDWMPLPTMLEKQLKTLDPAKDIVFLTRVAAMAPGIYLMSKLLHQMHGRTRVTSILFYPGSMEGTTGLRFMDLKDQYAPGNYRVKIYG